MKKGVQMFTVRDYLHDAAQVQDTLAKIRAIGYDSMQAATPDFLTHREFMQMMADAGLGTYSANADFEAMERDDAAFADAVAQAQAYGVGFIAVGTLPTPLRESREGYREYAARANALCARLKAEGLRLYYHPHALECYSLGGGETGMDILLAETDPEGFWFTLDTHWLQSGGLDVCSWIAKVKGRMDMIHFKDYAIAGGADEVEAVRRQFAEVGEGNLDWPAIVAACRANGVQAVCVEQDICPGSPFDSLAKSYANMVRLGV